VTDIISIQQHGMLAHIVQSVLQGAGNGAFSCANGRGGKEFVKDEGVRKNQGATLGTLLVTLLEDFTLLT